MWNQCISESLGNTLSSLSPGEPSFGGFETCRCNAFPEPRASKHRTYDASVSKLLSGNKGTGILTIGTYTYQFDILCVINMQSPLFCHSMKDFSWRNYHSFVFITFFLGNSTTQNNIKMSIHFSLR